MPLTLHLVRHAAHDLLPHTLAGRMPGVMLSGEGRAQAARLAKRFRDRPITAVVSSPVERARETALAIAELLGLPVEADAAWQEIDFGAWTGKRFDALDGDPAWIRWNRCRHLARAVDGETMHEVQSRVLGAIEAMRSARCDEELVVVSHADVIKSALAPALGLSLDLLHRITIDPASISTLVLYDHDVRVACLNA